MMFPELGNIMVYGLRPGAPQASTRQCVFPTKETLRGM